MPLTSCYLFALLWVTPFLRNRETCFPETDVTRARAVEGETNIFCDDWGIALLSTGAASE